ncbi:MAG: signal peptidase II [Acidobacteriota bacterium]
MRFAGFFFGCLMFDQLTKYVVRTEMYPGQVISLIDSVFSLTYVANRGGAFGLFQGMNLLFSLAAVIVLVGVLVFIKLKRPSILIVSALALIGSGAAGNLIDRFAYGAVIDFLHIRYWPVFNIADIAIVLGCAIIFLDMIVTDPNEVNQ